MKTRRYALTFAAFIAVTVVVYGCSDLFKLPSDTGQMAVEEYDHDVYRLITGSVDMQARDGAVAISVDEHPMDTDPDLWSFSGADELFILQTKNTVGPEFNRQINRAKVFYNDAAPFSDDDILVVSTFGEDAAAMGLFIRESDLRDVSGAWKLPVTATALGFGLAHYTPDEPVAMASSVTTGKRTIGTLEDYMPCNGFLFKTSGGEDYCADENGYPDVTCNAGGEGATSCSWDSCSVSCAEGYNACCGDDASGALSCECCDGDRTMTIGVGG